MKFKGLLISAVCLVALAGIVWWSNKNQPAGGKADNAIKILSIPEDQMTAIRIEKVIGDVIELRRAKDMWTLTQPQQLAADQDAAEAVQGQLTALNAERVVDEKPADLKQYGLDVPTLKVTVTSKDGKAHELLIGDLTPDLAFFYTKLASDPRVFTIAQVTKNTIDKNPLEFRLKRLMTFNRDKLSRVEIQGKGQTIAFAKTGQDSWQIVTPRVLRADSGQVNGLAVLLGDARLDPAETEEEAAPKFASAARVAVATLTDSDGTQSIEVRKDKDNNYYAKSSVTAGVWKTLLELGTGLEKSLDNYRNRKLFDFAFSDPEKVELKGASYVKSGDKWLSGSTAMDSASVQALIDNLRDLSAAKFADAGGGEPFFTANVTWNQGKQTDRVTITKRGDQYFATRANEPGAYELEPNVADELQKTAAGVKPAPAAAPAKK